MRYRSPNDTYFQKNLSRLIKRHGGKWVVVAKGRAVAVCAKKDLKRFFDLAKKRYPGEIPLVSPIPTREEIHCILLNFPTKK